MKLFSKKGFTLIELLIVVAIIAILAAIAVPNFLEAQTRSKVSRAKADMRSLSTAAEAYAVDNNDYPQNYGVAFDFLRILSQLSTPIAYVTDAHLPDAFGNIAYPDLGGNFVYFFFNLNPTEDLVELVYNQTLLWPTAFGQDEFQTLLDSRYAMISTGPDRIAEFHYVQPPFGSMDGIGAINHEGYVFVVGGDGFYDPTNGTISKGDMIRTGRGIEERKRTN
jgi:prepilin-type N-terminal cleavage/methylation domain-containing protein